MMDKKALISSLATRNAMEGDRRAPPEEESKEERGTTRKTIPYILATLFVNRDHIDDKLGEDRTPDKRPDLPRCYASNVRVPKSAVEIKKRFGLLDAF